jgi:hypothetical protein
MADEQEIDDYIQRAKSFYRDARIKNHEIALLLKQAGPPRKKFDTFFIAYDSYWTYYHCNLVSVRCKVPEDTLSLTTLPDCAKNCWKLLMFRRKPEEVKTSVNLLMPLLRNGEISSFKHNSDCLQQVSDGYVIVIYTVGVAERDNLKAKLQSIGFKNIPYRRGCKSFEQKFGPWRQWYPE